MDKTVHKRRQLFEYRVIVVKSERDESRIPNWWCR